MALDSVAAVHYAIDTKASQFTVQAFAGGLISAVAHSPKIAIREWTGDINFVPETLQNAKLKIVIKAESLEVLDDLRDSDRRELHRVMDDEVLEIKRYPTIEFESFSIESQPKGGGQYAVTVSGLLALHGVTNRHTFSAQVAFGVDSFRAFGDFTLLQSNYDITIASIAGGTLALQDQLKFSFYVDARQG